MKIFLFAALVSSELICKHQETCQECLLASPDCVWCDVKGKKFIKNLLFFSIYTIFSIRTEIQYIQLGILINGMKISTKKLRSTHRFLDVRKRLKYNIKN